jgi:lysozyme
MQATDEQISAAEATIAHFEGCSRTPYRDNHGYWTIGYGCRFLADGSAVTEHTQPLSGQGAAFALMRFKLCREYVPHLEQVITEPLSDGQFAAVCSLVWNIGLGGFGNSYVLRDINRRNPAAAAHAFHNWSFSAGKYDSRLFKRRCAEERIFTGMDPIPAMPTEGDKT